MPGPGFNLSYPPRKEVKAAEAALVGVGTSRRAMSDLRESLECDLHYIIGTTVGPFFL